MDFFSIYFFSCNFIIHTWIFFIFVTKHFFLCGNGNKPISCSIHKTNSQFLISFLCFFSFTIKKGLGFFFLICFFSKFILNYFIKSQLFFLIDNFSTFLLHFSNLQWIFLRPSPPGHNLVFKEIYMQIFFRYIHILIIHIKKWICMYSIY